MPLNHSSREAYHYKGAKGSKAPKNKRRALDEFIPKYKEPEEIARTYKHAPKVIELHDRIMKGEKLIRLDSTNPYVYRDTLKRTAEKLGLNLRFVANTEGQAVWVLPPKRATG